jgi:hypothetical protein
MTVRLEWETIDDNLQRAKVYGGWLVKTHEPVYHINGEISGDGWDWRVSMCFVPDPNHAGWGDRNNGNNKEEHS